METPTLNLQVPTSISSFAPAYAGSAGPETHKPTYDLLIYGATSFTGKLIIEYLCNHPQAQDFSFAIGGRTEAKLRDLQAQIEQRGLGRREIVHFTLNDSTTQDVKAISKAVGSCRVVINLAGPYSSQNAESLVRECASQGRHYVDLTGETPWVKEIVHKYDFLAWKNGACIVPSCGFDSVPGDLVALMSAQALVKGRQQQQRDDKDDAEITSSESYYWAKGGVSGGTVNSAYVTAEMEPERIKRASTEFALTHDHRGMGSIGLQPAYTNKLTGLNGLFWVMAPHNIAIVRRSWSIFQNPGPMLLHNSSSSTKKKNNGNKNQGQASLEPTTVETPKYGQQFTYDEALCFGAPRHSMGYIPTLLFGCLISAIGVAFMTSSWVRKLARCILPSTGTGPSEESQKNGWFQVVNISESSQGPAVVSTMAGRGDPGYFCTAQLLAEAALTLTHAHKDLPAIGQSGGVLTPATAMGSALIDRLSKYGSFDFETMGVDEWMRKRDQVRKWDPNGNKGQDEGRKTK